MAPSAAYLAAAADFSKQVQWLVEIDLDRCSLVYTVGACTAVDAGDGARCFYSFPTCQVASAYAKSTRTYRFCLNDVPWPDTATAVYPLLKEFTQAPHRVDTSSFFSYPDRITFKMLRDYTPNAIDSDKGAGFFNTSTAGEFWRNLFSRNRNYSGRAVRMLRGFNTSGFVLADFEQVGPTYELAKIDFGPGDISISVKSPLAKLRDTEITFPISDDNVLTAGVSAIATTLSVTDGLEFPNPATGHLGGAYVQNNIYVEIEDTTNGDEICQVTSIATNDLTVVRGSFGTSNVLHPISSKVKHICCFGTTAGAAVNSIDTLQDLMEWAGVAAGDIDTTAFDNVRDIYWPGDDVLRILRGTKTVAKLMQEIREVRGILIYLDADAKWSCSMIGPRTSVASYDDDSMRNVRVIEDDDERRTRAALWYDPVEDNSREPEDFRKASVVVDTDLETANNYGDVKERRVLDMWTAPAYAAGKVRNMVSRILARTAHGVRIIEFELEIKDGVRYVGDAVTLATRELTDFYGTQASIHAIITSRREAGRGAIKYTAVDTGYSGPYFVWGPDTMSATYDAATAADKAFGYWGDGDNRVGASLVEGYKIL